MRIDGSLSSLQRLGHVECWRDDCTSGQSNISHFCPLQIGPCVVANKLRNCGQSMCFMPIIVDCSAFAVSMNSDMMVSCDVVFVRCDMLFVMPWCMPTLS